MRKYTFKELSINLAIAYLALGLIPSILILFDVTSFNLNGKPTSGIKGFLAVLFFSPIYGLCFACLTYITLNLGRYIYNLFFDFREE